MHSACRLANYFCVPVYKLSLFYRPRKQELYRTESLHPPGHPVTAGVPTTVLKRHPVFRAGTCVPNTAIQAGRSQVRFPMVSMHFFIDIILRAAL